MGIHALCLQEYERFNSARSTLARHTDRAVEWFADDTGDILGAIVYHPGDLAWSWVVVARDHDDGTFRALDRDAARRALDDARRQLVEKMAMALR
jgi:hypothetical protein